MAVVVSLGRDGRVAYGDALLRRWWQHRVGSNPTPSVCGCRVTSRSRFGRVAEWLKAHDWKSCGHSPRGFESHPVRYMYAVRIRTHAIFAEDRRVGSSRATQVGPAKRRPRRLARRRRVAPSIPPRPLYVCSKNSNPRDLRRRSQSGFEPSDTGGSREAPTTATRETTARSAVHPTPSALS